MTIAVVSGRIRRWSGRRHSKQLPAALKLLRTMAVADEAKVPDAVKPVRQHVDQEAADASARPAVPATEASRRALSSDRVRCRELEPHSGDDARDVERSARRGASEPDCARRRTRDYAALAACAGEAEGWPVGLIHFGAHVDTWPDNFGQPDARGSVFFQAIEEGIVDPSRVVQIGIPSPIHREVWIGLSGAASRPRRRSMKAGASETAAGIRAVIGSAPAYPSFDVDALDPASAPGTGTPEIGGLASWRAQALLRRLGVVRWIGVHVVEVAPPYGVAEITALAAATIVWEYLALWQDEAVSYARVRAEHQESQGRREEQG